MKLLYTVSSGFMNPQNYFVNSLGGFVSSTQVPNDTFDNIFDELSVSEIKEGRNQYRAVVLQNDTDEEVQDVKLWIESSPNNVCSYQIAAIMMNVNEDGEYSMESIPTTYSKPTQAQFFDATVDDKASIGNMAPGQMIGLWLMRKIDKKKAITEYNDVAERDYSTQTRYKPIEKIKEETLNLQITWN